MPLITVLPHNRILEAQPGQTVHQVLAREGLIHAPCGGQGTCGKCKVVVDGQEVLACQTPADRDMTVSLPQATAKTAHAVAGKRAAFDIGTTTVVCYLLDASGSTVAQASARNPQAAFGADVISRIRAALDGHANALTRLIRKCMADLLCSICSDPAELETVAVVGNPAMQQLFLGKEVSNLAKIPFSPILCKPEVLDCAAFLPCCPNAKLLTVPDVSGFVGADTVAGILSCGLQETEETTLLVDIGTNGEMVLAANGRRIACATAAGPALEGANIQFGMRAEPGAIDRVYLENGELRYHVIGDTEARGLCGSGLLDAIACAMDLGLVNRRGKIERKIMLTNEVWLTQEDIRQVQLAKGAIAAGIRLMIDAAGIPLSSVKKVVLAGAFGTYLDPKSACRIGLLPQALLPKITAIGNAAGNGAVMLAADPGKLAVTAEIAETTEFLELASLPSFPKTFARAMELPENWLHSAKALGFDQAFPLNPATLHAREDVRAMCQADKCRAYGKNWTCPPHCGTLAECEEKMQSYKHGILLQTVGHLTKAIDSRGYRAAEQHHLEHFARFCEAVKKQYPNALCLGAGGCRVCKACAYPDTCRFPEKATPSMESYGLFVTEVCRDCGAEYYHGEKTITYTACVLYG